VHQHIDLVTRIIHNTDNNTIIIVVTVDTLDGMKLSKANANQAHRIHGEARVGSGCSHNDPLARQQQICNMRCSRVTPTITTVHIDCSPVN
jgi:hypothetical protein